MQKKFLERVPIAVGNPLPNSKCTVLKAEMMFLPLGGKGRQ